MTEQEYLENRLQTQINWYSQKSTLNKKYYHGLKTAEIIISVSIPLFTGYMKEYDVLKYVIAILALLVAIIAGLLVLFKFQEKWIEYRVTSESLKQEKYMFLTRSGPYRTDLSVSNLAERVETIISKENATWNQLLNKKEDTKIKEVNTT